uniref:Cilia- and flagella-associated protein 36 n=1 Tax=Aureoumbra lagunensis TaxID=44058 RepID=A0A7S3NL56_9STRA|mmetsp:Transcript_19229/g.24954  ORF Transcript_19229/g.24954 Transcript_19229/m.24954 type:complete len:140 (+) Transcript_19229:58-477(+)
MERKNDDEELIESDERHVESIVTKVSRYFFSERSFAGTLERWVERNAENIDLDASDEFQLKYTELHQEFKNIYERMLEEFIISQGSTTKEFYAELKREADSEKDGTLLAETILATTDFDIFMRMMRDYRMQLDHRNHHK